MRDARMRCAMLGCDARCQDAMRDARMRCAMLHSILASHPGIAHRILASRIAFARDHGLAMRCFLLGRTLCF